MTGVAVGFVIVGAMPPSGDTINKRILLPRPSRVDLYLKKRTALTSRDLSS
jgi:hypothetical protein